MVHPIDTAADERLAIVVAQTSCGITLTVGETVVAVRTPRSAGDASLSEDQLRASALRSARRALEVALEEIGLKRG